MTRSPSPPTKPASAAAAPPPEVLDVESDFVVILAVLLCALICVVGLIAVARCAWLRRYPGRGGAGGGPAAPSPRPPPAANRGLKRKALQSLPKIVYGLEEAAAVGAARFPVECAICLGEFSEGDEVRLLPQCGHGFHVGCIDQWLRSHSSCPSCRQILVVARCQKCGHFPAVPGDGTEAQLKAREDGGNSNSFLP
ncbi:RING-H2 finger protein ATL80-like [Rhodamnia argentea]|uniref:RING-H2 finger protein ATL80-like n=1 Tax=Rhodamnia argentea TaxID=178133 RepID=A0ABM3GW79_9MYRT|nr:RING-H2 finger protein ATL80-like [Rhodamnia argentea]